MSLDVPAFVVIGGGSVGAGYVRQLLRASAAGRLRTRSIVVVDRDSACAAARFADPFVRLDVADWNDWLDRHLAESAPGAHLVPYHWAPHLLRDWLAREVEKRGGAVHPGPALPPFGLPYETATRAGDRALSYATWPCPPSCIEPALCPHTRGPKDWSLAGDLETRPAPGIDARAVFRCLHLVYGVGTIPIADILAARDRMLAGPAARWLVGTASHCHALAAAIDVTPLPSGGD